ncbi:MAG TPA: tripartite tricarboxylate transporter TctB family protein [Candidatus Limnocylindrales bacterium]|nr:tripartite tricarboxylate transporter TctB family protein [Candidatus Limnocylindrales bacterium]
MKVKVNLRFLFALAVALVAAYAVYASLGWPRRASLFPRLIGLPLLLLALGEMILSARGGVDAKEGHAVDFEFSKNIDPTVVKKRTLAIFLWVIGFLMMILLVGFPVAVPLFVFLYMKLGGGEGWLLSITLTVCSWIFIEGLFDRLLHIPMPPGWLLTYFTGNP